MSAISLLLRGLSKAVPKKEVAKRGSEVIGRKPEKFMGMADEVKPSRLSGPKAGDGIDDFMSKRRDDEFNAIRNTVEGSSKTKRALGVGAGLAGAATAALLSGKGKDESDSKSEDRPVRDSGRESAGKEEQPKSSSSFGAAFKAARAEGKDVFTFQGKKYTTEMAGEKKSSSKESQKETGVREGRNENIDEDTRKRAMESVANLAKGGAVKKYAKGGMIQANCGASMKPAQSKKY